MTTRSLTEVLSADELAFIVEPPRDLSGDVADFGAECERAGASAISISVDAGFGRGDIGRVRAACGLPVIARGDVTDAATAASLRDAGADAVMTRIVDDLDTVAREVRTLGMDLVLVVRDEQELEVALETDIDVLGIDNRNDDGTVDVELTFDLLAQVPAGWPVISESIASLEQVPRLHRAGVDALLLDEGHLDTGLQAALEAYAAASLEG